MMTARTLLSAVGVVLVLSCGLQADPTKGPPKLIRQAQILDRAKGKAAELVIRSQEDMEKKLTKVEQAKVGKVDFDKRMALAIRTGTIQSFGVTLNIEKIEVAKDGKELLVTWKYRPYFGGAAPPPQQGNLTLLAVLEEYPGEVKLKKTVHRFKGPFPPSAPPPSRP